MIRTSLIIDGNYLLYKSVFALRQSKSIDMDLENVLFNDFNRVIHTYNYDDIFFASDMGSSWRKDNFPSYKSDRKKDELVDWENVYNIYNSFKEELYEKPNINMYEFPKLEGDDIVAYLTNKLNEKGYSVVIIANDKDLHQLIKFDINKGYVNILWNNRLSDSKVYMPENYQVYVDSLKNSKSIDLFDDESEYDNEFIKFLEELKYKNKVVEINNEKSLFCKIVEGDNSDNIKSIYMKDGRGIAEKGAEKVYELYKDIFAEPINFDDPDFLHKMVEIVSYYKKVEEDDTLKKVIFLNTIDNMKLIRLEEKYLPEHLLKQMQDKIKL